MHCLIECWMSEGRDWDRSDMFWLELSCCFPCLTGEVVSVEKTVKRCLLDTFKHTDEEFLKQASSQ